VIGYFITNPGHPETPLAAGVLTWARWFEKENNRRVDLTETAKGVVSTVFLGIGVDDPPLLWETMVFGGEHNEYQERYATYAEALEGHARAVAMVLA
jgi:hypothetical protein